MSSAKCNYSDMYYPLVDNIMQGTDPNVQKQQLEEYFNESAEQVINRSGVKTSTPITPVEVKVDTHKTMLPVQEEKLSVEKFYINSPSKYRAMSHNFMRNMVECAIYRPGHGRVAANSLYEDKSYLNTYIIEYKTELLNKIVTYLQTEGEFNTEGKTLDELQKDAIQKCRTLNIKNDAVYDAFVILSNFDTLLSQYAPFISVAPEYMKASQYHPKRYVYNGATAKHYTHVMSTNEFMSAEENSSELATQLLKYFPEIDANGKEIPGTSINLSGFYSAMTKVYA